jgi:uncharacterized protein
VNILITGATGFIGRALVLRLLREGHRPIALVRSVDRARNQLGSETELVAGSGETNETLVEALSRSQAVVNLAGEPIFGKRWTSRQRKRLVDSRVNTTRHLVEAMEAVSPRPGVLVSASAIGYYGISGEGDRTEQSPPGKDFLADLCDAWEKEAQAAKTLGLRVVIPRIGIVLGLGGGALQTMLPLFRKGLGGPVGSGRQPVSWIHLHDLVEMVAYALSDQSIDGVFNATTPNPVTNREFAKALGLAIGRSSRLRAPALAVKAALGKASSSVLNGQRVLPERLIKAGFGFAHENIETALGDLFSDAGIETGRATDIPDSEYLSKRKPRYMLKQHIDIGATIDDVFPFFSRPANLGLLTPPDMSFDIQSELPDEMIAGTQIDYRIRLGSLPMNWTTRIEEFKAGTGFVDSQIRGPYRSWWHEHRFQAMGERTAMDDRVLYSLPMGPFGRMGGGLIRRKLMDIFRYRSQAIRFRFGAG